MNKVLFLKIDGVDKQILLRLQRLRRRPLTLFLYGLTLSGTGVAWFSAAALLTVAQYSGLQIVTHQAAFLRAMFSPLLAFALGSFLKKRFRRPRPSAALVGFESITTMPTCGSFPSSHAASSISFFVTLVGIGHPWAPFAGLWAALVSFSRLYLGVHYLSDVIGGFILGLISALAILLLAF